MKKFWIISGVVLGVVGIATAIWYFTKKKTDMPENKGSKEKLLNDVQALILEMAVVDQNKTKKLEVIKQMSIEELNTFYTALYAIKDGQAAFMSLMQNDENFKTAYTALLKKYKL